MELSCEISQADAPVRWYKDSMEVEESPSLILEVDGAHRRLVIPFTSVDDAGEYICDTEDDSVAFLVTIDGKNERNKCDFSKHLNILKGIISRMTLSYSMI